MRRYGLLLILLLAAGGGVVWWQRGHLLEWWQEELAWKIIVKADPPKPDPEGYKVLGSELERWRVDLAERHAKARTAADRAAVELEARELLELALPSMMRCWLGTSWDFNGTSETPGAGRIACGYFVSTVLRDAGFRLNRFHLAQQPSENILRSFLPRDACGLTVGQPYDNFADCLAEAEPGIYIVGLDTHVGFIVVAESSYQFIHSSGSRPWCVVEEDREAADVLRKSNWRMLGNLTASAAVIRRWLAGEKIVVRGT